MMEFRFIKGRFVFCLKHGKIVPVDNNPDEQEWHFDEIGNIPCYGPFAETPPPPPLTEEDWENIFKNGQEKETVHL